MEEKNANGEKPKKKFDSGNGSMPSGYKADWKLNPIISNHNNIFLTTRTKNQKSKSIIN